MNKLILDKNTSINDIADFLRDLGKDAQIRARSLGDGRIKLYVRKNTFKQFFTDKLRPAFLVKNDYQKAQTHILEMISSADPRGENSHLFIAVREELNSHKHDFYKKTLNWAVTTELFLESEINAAKRVLDSAQGQIAQGFRIDEFLDTPEAKNAIELIIDTIDSDKDKSLFQRNLEALKKVTKNIVSTIQPTTIDYQCAIDFSRIWLEGTKKINSDTERADYKKSLNEIINKITTFAKNVKRDGVPPQIDFNGGAIRSSDADLVIFDSSAGFSIADGPLLDSEFETNSFHLPQDNSSVAFTIKHCKGGKETAKKDFTVGFQIIYHGEPKIRQGLMECVYSQIEAIIDKKMSQKMTSSSTTIAENDSTKFSYTIHLPILNPFSGSDLNHFEKNVLQRAFVEATHRWATKYPDLRIKV